MYPENMDTHTKLLLLVAQNIFCRHSEEEVVDFVSTTDFQSFWQHANEDVQSLESGCHFGHYKVASGHYKMASYDRYLTAMHAAKLTLVASTRVTLSHWGNGFTVLLEKVFGNIYIDKMQAI